MKDLKRIKERLAELHKRQDANTAARKKVEQLRSSLASKTDSTSQELDALALTWATTPESDETTFLECHDRLTRCNALEELAARADKGLAPILADKAPASEISMLSAKIDLADKRAGYIAICDLLHENYDIDLEQKLVAAARAAGVTNAELDADAVVYRKKHGMSVPSMYPLNLADQF